MNNMKKKILLIVTVLLITISSFAQFSGGSGTEADPYRITTAQDLNNIRNYLGSGLCFKLMNDIDLTSFLSTTTTGWTPIGEYSKSGDVGIAFKGNFDGNGHTISGLWIDLDYPEGTKDKCAGLFGYMAYGNLQNLNVETNSEKNIKCNNCGYVGILVGYKSWDYYQSNAFTSCSVKGNVQVYGDEVRVGLLSGCVTGWVNYCRAEGNVYNNATYVIWTGGLVGYSGSCNESAFIGSVTCNGSTYDAGLLSGTSAIYGISNCYAVGNLNIVSIENAATIGGLASSEIIENSYCSVNISCNNPLSNAIIGSFLGETRNMPHIKNNFYNSDICSFPPIGNQTNVPSNAVFGLTASQMKHQANFTNWNFNTIWKIDEGVSMPYLQIIEKDATLSDLKVNGNLDGFTPYSFNKDSLNYSTSQKNGLDYSVKEVTITAKTNYPKATVSGLGTHPLKVGDNTFNVVVTSQDGSVQNTYTVFVKRAASNNTKLSSLTVSEGTLSPSFNADTKVYSVSVENSVSSITVSATPEDPNATVSGIGTIPLNVGQNYIHILVTAANGTSMTYYYVYVTRKNVNGIEDISENQFTIYPNPTKENLNIETPFHIESVEITDLSGRIFVFSTINERVSTEQSRGLNISSLPAGIYLVKIKTEEGIIVKKLVKE